MLDAGQEAGLWTQCPTLRRMMKARSGWGKEHIPANLACSYWFTLHPTLTPTARVCLTAAASLHMLNSGRIRCPDLLTPGACTPADTPLQMVICSAYNTYTYGLRIVINSLPMLKALMAPWHKAAVAFYLSAAMSAAGTAEWLQGPVEMIYISECRRS